MNDVPLMAVIYSRKYLFYYFGSVSFAEVLFLRNLVEELSSIAQPIEKVLGK